MEGGHSDDSAMQTKLSAVESVNIEEDEQAQQPIIETEQSPNLLNENNQPAMKEAQESDVDVLPGVELEEFNVIILPIDLDQQPARTETEPPSLIIRPAMKENQESDVGAVEFEEGDVTILPTDQDQQPPARTDTEPPNLIIRPAMKENQESDVGAVEFEEGDVTILPPDQDQQPPARTDTEPRPNDKNEIIRLKSIVMKLKTLLKHSKAGKAEEIKKRMRKVHDMLSASHSIVINLHKDKYEELINEIQQNHEAKADSITEYYEKRIESLEEDYHELVLENTALKEKEISLLKLLENSNERLENIQRVLTGDLKFVQINPGDTDDEDDEYMKTEIGNLTKKLRQREQQILIQNERIENLEKCIKAKEASLSNMTCQMYHYKDLLTKEDSERKLLEREKQELVKSFESMQNRHNDQFRSYEKLIRKAKEEVGVHKREVDRLRDHCGNFPPSPASRNFKTKYPTRRLSNSTPDLQLAPSEVNTLGLETFQITPAKDPKPSTTVVCVSSMSSCSSIPSTIEQGVQKNSESNSELAQNSHETQPPTSEVETKRKRGRPRKNTTTKK